MQQSKVINYF